MVFHRRLSDSKSPQVSRTLLSILAVFNSAVVWMVSTRQPTSKSSSPFNDPLVTVPKAPNTIGIIAFSILIQRSRKSLFSHSFRFILRSAGTAKSTILQIFFFFFFVDYYKVWSSGRCWVVHIPFVGMVKFKFLAQFPVDHLAYPVVSSLVLLLCQFVAFDYYLLLFEFFPLV